MFNDSNRILLFEPSVSTRKNLIIPIKKVFISFIEKNKPFVDTYKNKTLIVPIALYYHPKNFDTTSVVSDTEFLNLFVYKNQRNENIESVYLLNTIPIAIPYIGEGWQKMNKYYRHKN